MNRKTNPKFIKLKHSIQSCLNQDQLETLRGLVLKYHKEHKDGGELMAYFVEKETDLNPELV